MGEEFRESLGEELRELAEVDASTFHVPLEVDAADTRRDNRDVMATGTIRGAARGRAGTSAFGQPPRSPSQPDTPKPYGKVPLCPFEDVAPKRYHIEPARALARRFSNSSS